MSPKELDAALRALAHHERRTLLLGCLDRRRSAGELAERSTLAMATVSEHLKVLRKTGLVTVEKEGRFWFYRTDADRLSVVIAALSKFQGGIHGS
jgi:DNA-binding transcriptional ArsR family regulator